MRAALWSGGAAYGAYWAGYHYADRTKYDAYIGSSTGALIAVIKAASRVDPRMNEVLLYEYMNTTNREMYGLFHPYRKDGKLSLVKMAGASYIMIRNKRNYLYDISKALEAKLKRNFKDSHFKALRKAEIDVIITTKNIDVLNSGTTYHSILERGMDYERFCKLIVSSASIPFFAKPPVIDGFQHVDGGVLDNAPTKLIERYKDVDVFLCSTELDTKQKGRKAKDWIMMAKNVFHAFRAEIHVDDLEGIGKKDIYYMERMNFDSSDFNKTMMRKAVKMGMKRWKREHD